MFVHGIQRNYTIFMWQTSDWAKVVYRSRLHCLTKKLRAEHELNTHKHMLIKLQMIAPINNSKICEIYIIKPSNCRFEHGNNCFNNALCSMNLPFIINLFDIPNNNHAEIQIYNFVTGGNLLSKQQFRTA